MAGVWMSTTKFKALAICFLAAFLRLTAFGQTPTTSELLQKGIYLQETVGDLDGAIKVYRQIVQMARQSRVNAAQAEYRLGMCLLKKGRQAEAAEAFQKLIKEYPEQTDLVAKARPYAASVEHAPVPARMNGPPPQISVSRPGELKLLPAAWKDGEVLEYTRKNQTDSTSTAFTIWRSFQNPDSERWLYEERAVGLFDRLEFDPETMQPARLFEANSNHSFRLSYQRQTAQIVESDGKRLAPIDLQGRVFDAREIPAILPRLPLAKGYKVTLPLFWASSGSVSKYEFAVVGEETIRVPAGEFHCYIVEESDLTSNAFAFEKFWISNDAARLIVRSDRQGWSDELDLPPQNNPEESIYRDDDTGVSFKVPAGWKIEKPPRGEEFVRWYLRDLHSSAFVTLRVFPYEAGDFTPEQLRSELEKSLAENNVVTVRPESWWTRQIAGHAAASCIEDLPRYHQVRYQAWVRTGASAADMFADADPQSLNALRPTFDAIIDSLVIK
jgi:tetratricopeptide (TPR) repeat protein